MSSPNLLTDSIPSLLWKLGLPAGIGFFFNTIYNVTDAYWAGRLGIEATTAMSQTFPIFLLLIVFGSGLSSAASALIGNALGAKNKHEVRSFLQHILFLFALLVIFVTPLLVFLAPSILSLTGDPTPTVQALSLAYITPVLLCAFVFLGSYVLNGVLTAYGDTKTYSTVLIVGSFLNIGLNPLLMYGVDGFIPAFGISGLAYATISLQFLWLLYMGFVVSKRGIFAWMRWKHWRLNFSHVKSILSIAIPASLSMMLVSVGIFIINAFLKDFGTTVMAIYGVGTRIEQIVLLPTIGLSVAAAAIIAQNNGAKQFDRVRKTYLLSLLSGVVIVVPLIIAIWFLSDFLYSFFIVGSDPAEEADIFRLWREYTVVVTGLFWAYIAFFITTNALQAIKRPMFALVMNFLRQIVLPFIVFSLVVHYGGNYLSIWWSIFGIVWFSALVAVWYGCRTFSRLK